MHLDGKASAQYRYWTGGHSGSSPYCPRAASTYLSGLLLCSECTVEAAVGFEPTHRGFADLSLTTWVRRPGVCANARVSDVSTPPPGVQLCAAASGVLLDEIGTLLNRAVLSKILDEVALTAAQSAENRLAGTVKPTDLSRAPQP